MALYPDDWTVAGTGWVDVENKIPRGVVDNRVGASAVENKAETRRTNKKVSASLIVRVRKLTLEFRDLVGVLCVCAKTDGQM